MLQNNTKQWINTRVEYQWSDELDELVQLSKEGYWYEGEMTLCAMTTRTNDDANWAFRDHNTYGSDVNMYYLHGGGYGLALNVPDSDSNKYVFEVLGQGSGQDQTFIVKGDGKVGIGTGTPVTRLDVVSNSESWMLIKSDADDNSADTDCGIYFQVDAGVAKGIIKFDEGLNAFCLGFGNDLDISILASGNVGIGSTAPAYKLDVVGTFYSSGSSIEYKQEVEPYTPPEGALMSLEPVQYQYKDEWKDFGKRYAGNSNKQLGLVAEDVAKVLPELAVTKTENGKEVVRNVDYEKLTVLLVSEVQKLRTELDEIKNY